MPACRDRPTRPSDPRPPTEFQRTNESAIRSEMETTTRPGDLKRQGDRGRRIEGIRIVLAESRDGRGAAVNVIGPNHWLSPLRETAFKLVLIEMTGVRFRSR